MQLMAEALSAVQSRLDAEGVLNAWQVGGAATYLSAGRVCCRCSWGSLHVLRGLTDAYNNTRALRTALLLWCRLKSSAQPSRLLTRCLCQMQPTVPLAVEADHMPVQGHANKEARMGFHCVFSALAAINALLLRSASPGRAIALDHKRCHVFA